MHFSQILNPELQHIDPGDPNSPFSQPYLTYHLHFPHPLPSTKHTTKISENTTTTTHHQECVTQHYPTHSFITETLSKPPLMGRFRFHRLKKKNTKKNAKVMVRVRERGGGKGRETGKQGGTLFTTDGQKFPSFIWLLLVFRGLLVFLPKGGKPDGRKR